MNFKVVAVWSRLTNISFQEALCCLERIFVHFSCCLKRQLPCLFAQMIKYERLTKKKKDHR